MLSSTRHLHGCDGTVYVSMVDLAESLASIFALENSALLDREIHDSLRIKDESINRIRHGLAPAAAVAGRFPQAQCRCGVERRRMRRVLGNDMCPPVVGGNTGHLAPGGARARTGVNAAASAGVHMFRIPPVNVNRKH